MRKVALSALILILISCNNSHIPSGIIKPPQMEDILWDMIRGDVLAQQIVKNDSSRDLKITSLELSQKVLAIHNIDRSKFEKSVTFYQNHPDLMKAIFDSISASQPRRSFMQLKEKAKVNYRNLSPANKKIQ